jgi:hypothetical protein
MGECRARIWKLGSSVELPGVDDRPNCRMFEVAMLSNLTDGNWVVQGLIALDCLDCEVNAVAISEWSNGDRQLRRHPEGRQHARRFLGEELRWTVRRAMSVSTAASQNLSACP